MFARFPRYITANIGEIFSGYIMLVLVRIIKFNGLIYNHEYNISTVNPEYKG